MSFSNHPPSLVLAYISLYQHITARMAPETEVLSHSIHNRLGYWYQHPRANIQIVRQFKGFFAVKTDFFLAVQH